MTKIYYLCFDLMGGVYKTYSLEDAKNYVKKHGGHYTQREDITKSISEPYCMKKHRTL